ncbi:multidrug resistance efflux transporter family protein [Orbus wheelerorum]|uniref:DMT family transporter n=1 Tax=Orbus wheelerorum TaxID=3074111 RepID=UPI00370D4E39
MKFQELRKAMVLGTLAAFFFAFTFLLNKLMAASGGHWIWSSSLRFYWMLPFFLVIVLIRKNLLPLLAHIKANLLAWVIWSTVGFGLFYAPLTYSASFSPSWLVASTWQFTIIAGVLLAPFIYKNRAYFSIGNFLFSLIILLGIIIMQLSQVATINTKTLMFGSSLIIFAAFCYPLGNRKTILMIKGELDVYQRILGMIICSLPFWLILNLYAILVEKSLPTAEQIQQTFIVGLFSGVIATSLFFYATQLVSHNHKALACVESTQSGEVIFTLIGEMIILHIALPSLYALIGMAIIIIGMILSSLCSK